MAKHKYIESPEKMWELFLEYKNHVKSNPIKKHVFVGKDGVADWELRERPLTIEGFKNYCRRNVGCIHDYLANTNNAYDEYSTICRAIKEEIKQDQIEGGMASIYNPSITQRLNGLTEKTENKNDNTHSGKIQIEVVKTDVPLANNEKDIKID